MPELPEVENMARQLNAEFSGRVIKAVPFVTASMLKYPNALIFRRAISGARILGVSRRAKYVVFKLNGDRTLLIHPKMTGHFLMEKRKINNLRKKEKDLKHIRFVFAFDGGRELYFSDVRKFGTIRLFNKDELEKFWAKERLGPEPLGLKFDEFVDLISSKTGKIKQVLIDPKVIVGIGNIYSDEMLYVAGIHPERRAKALSREELGRLYKAMRQILETGVALGGSSISNYQLLRGEKGKYQEIKMVYGREGEPCGKCFQKIKRIRMGGRSAHFCPNCQIIATRKRRLKSSH
jgi:formamidopyrimidine-DNA glycosylase